MKKYKVWIQIEEVDEEQNHYEDIDLPYEAGCFETKDLARKFVDDKLLTLCEQSPDFPPKSIMLRLFAENGKLWIRPEGYGEKCTMDGEGFPVGMEIWQGRLRLIVFDDINSEDARIIDLENASEACRITQ